MTRKLANKTAIVTGAARGLGRAYALRLAALGANVAVVDVDLGAFGEFAEEKESMTADSVVMEVETLGVAALGITADVTDPAAMKKMAEAVWERWKRIDIVVCNAGGGVGRPDESKASRLDLDQTDLVIRRNLYGTIHSCLAVTPYMRKQGFGKVITVASQAGTSANSQGGYAHYAAAKAAIVNYTRNLAQDLGCYGITANCISPGYIATGRMMLSYRDRGIDRVESRIALGRLGTPSDCAGVIEFLATDLSDYVTGAVVPVDGGSLRRESP